MAEQQQIDLDGATDAYRDLRTRVVALIGEEATSKLQEAGMVVVEAADLNRYECELEAKKERLLKLTRAAVEAAGTRALIFEVRARDGEIDMLLCDPTGDEPAMAKKIADALKMVTHRKPDRDRRPARVGKGGKR